MLTELLQQHLQLQLQPGLPQLQPPPGTAGSPLRPLAERLVLTELLQPHRQLHQQPGLPLLQLPLPRLPPRQLHTTPGREAGANNAAAAALLLQLATETVQSF